MSKSLAGKVAIVTGSGQGLGRAEALALAAEDAHVVVNDVSIANAQAVVDEIIAAGGSGEANASDVSDWEGGKALVDQAIAVNGALDILVCNAGIVRDRMIWNMTVEEWDAVIRVHLRGHFVPIRFAAEHWRNRSKESGEPVYGRIITTTSEAGLYGNVSQGNYNAAKGGIVGFTLGVARELARFGVTANSISPRGRTPMTDGAFGGISIMEGDFDTWDPANVGPWVTYLAGPDAASISGQVFVVHGGTVTQMDGWDAKSEIRQSKIWTQDEFRAGAAERLVPGLVAEIPDFPAIVPVEPTSVRNG